MVLDELHISPIAGQQNSMKRKPAKKRQVLEQLASEVRKVTLSHRRLLRVMRGQIAELGQLRKYVLELRVKHDPSLGTGV